MSVVAPDGWGVAYGRGGAVGLVRVEPSVIPCEHRKDGTPLDTFVLCGEPSTALVSFGCVAFSAPMCAEHARDTVNDDSIGDAYSEPMERIHLTAEQWDAVQRMIDDPSPPTQALVDLFKEFPS